jgi:hypothetical protein
MRVNLEGFLRGQEQEACEQRAVFQGDRLDGMRVRAVRGVEVIATTLHECWALVAGGRVRLAMVGPLRVGSARSSRAEGRWRWLASRRRSQPEVEITGVEEGKLGVREFRRLVTDGSGFWSSCSANRSPPTC